MVPTLLIADCLNPIPAKSLPSLLQEVFILFVSTYIERSLYGRQAKQAVFAGGEGAQYRAIT
jgi:hypothetical protein